MSRRYDIDDLLAEHQAIIDACVAEFMAKVKAHANFVWAKRAQSEEKK